jgi:hypothetical protein
VSNAEECTPPGSASVFNTAYLDGSGGSSASIQVQTGQSCADDGTGTIVCVPTYTTYEFECAAPAALSDTARADVTCEGTPPTFHDGDYCAYTQGGYGGRGGPYNLLSGNFTTVFPTGIEVGIPGAGGYSMKFTTAAAVQAYLPDGSTADVLTEDLVNPESTSAGVFGAQVLTLKINVAESGATNGTPAGFGSLYYCKAGDTLSGSTVAQILAAMETALGGGAVPAGQSITSLNALADDLNKNSFHECVVGPFSQYLSTSPCN